MSVNLLDASTAVGSIVRASTGAGGLQANGESRSPVFSPDGKRVVFTSWASNLVPDDTNNQPDIFVKDLVTGTVTRVSTTAAGEQANSMSQDAVFSPDGTRVAFTSHATNLVPGDTNGAWEVFLKDLNTGAVTRVFTNADWWSASAAFSPDGNYLAVTSASDIRVKNLVDGSVTAIPVGIFGGQGPNYPIFSPDGTSIAFQGSDPNLVPGDTNQTSDVYIKNLTTGVLTRVSTSATGSQGNAASFGPVGFSPDGARIAFYSQASNFVANDTNNNWDVFVKDLATGDVTRISSNVGGAAQFFWQPSFSPDGTRVVFADSSWRVFVYDLAASTNNLISTSVEGGLSSGFSHQATFSPDGTRVLFMSTSATLLPGDTNASPDIFIKTILLPTVPLVVGSEGDDTLAGGEGAEEIRGLGGNDLLYGNGGNDTLIGGTGDDRFFDVGYGDLVDGGDGADVLLFDASARTDDITINLLTGLGAGAAWTSVELIAGTLGGGDDSVTAAIQWVDLVGGAGIDTLTVDYSGIWVDGQTVSALHFQNLPSSGIVAIYFSGGNSNEFNLGGFERFNIIGSSGDDIIAGGDLGNLLSGGNGNDSLYGGSGTDSLSAGGGNDLLFGGEGVDVVSFEGPLVRYTVSRDPGSGVWTVIDTLISGEGTDTVAADVEILRFSDISLSMVPALAVSTVATTLLEGNTGTKPLTFTITRTGELFLPSSAIWTLSGAADAADFAGGTLPSGTVTFAAGEATQTITLTIAGDRVAEADEALTLTLASPINATLATASASVTIVNDDTAFAIAALNADRAEGNTGPTAFTFTVTRSGDLSGASSVAWAVTGSGARPTNSGDFTGGSVPRGTLSFAAGEASQVITIQVAGDTRYEGDEGFTVTLSNASAGASITTATASALIRDDDIILGTAAADTLRGTGFADSMRGLAGDDLMQADDGNDTIEGNEGNDTLIGGLGADSLIGGEGTDTASYANAAAVALSLLTGGTGGDAQGDRFAEIENLLGSRFADALTGDDGANLLNGGEGNDTLTGGAGDDTLLGGAGGDSLVGGEGRDVVTFLSNIALTVDLNGVGSTGEAAGDSYSGIEDVIGRASGDTLLGSAVANLLDGAAGDDSLVGREGDDTLLGGAGNDTLLGGAGDDSLSGGDGLDLLSYADAGAGVTVSLALLAAQATGGAGLDVISGFENLTGSGFADHLTGDTGANRLIGGGGNDSLLGGAGNDTLEGGGGADSLTGGAGADRFVFRAIDDSAPRFTGRDVILDFSRAEGDAIDLRPIDANPFLDGDQAFRFILGDFTGAGGEVGVVGVAGRHRVEMDLDGDGVTDMAITVLTPLRVLASTDFLL